METLGSFLDSLAVQYGDREAVAYAPHDHVVARLTWKGLRTASREAAKKLVGAGVGKGTRVGFLCSNRLEWLPIAFGALRIGALLVPFSTLWKRDEIAYALAHADVERLIMLPGFLKHDYVATLTDIVPELRQPRARGGQLYACRAPALRQVVLVDGEAPGTERWADLPATVDDAFLDALERTVAPSDWATVFFTSGTTAQAKAVLHCHAALTTSGRRISPCFGITPDDAWWGHMPLFWSGGFVLGALATLAGGARVVLQEAVDPASALKLLEAERCSIMAGWHQAGPLLDHPDFATHRLHLKKGTNHTLATRLLGPDHMTIGVYGMSETATCVTAARWDDPEHIRSGTFGKPLDGMLVKIINPQTGQRVADGESGEIHVKGPTLMEGYYKVPRSQAFDAEGFFKTGDIGYFDAAGYLHFATRLKDVIKTAGVNVAAVEVEEALQRHPAVKSAYVVGVPHPTRGENVAAFVVRHPEAVVSEAALRDFCKASLASYKVPRHVFTISESEVPRTGSGKVEKAALRRAAAARLEGKS
ncbi:MAG TPA: AMP-binding protein [Candidatus Margulisiibacteriota bacterium]|nr:AMP-binding protein [Candidatus Margulisiibacteriota bacterium]